MWGGIHMAGQGEMFLDFMKFVDIDHPEWVFLPVDDALLKFGVGLAPRACQIALWMAEDMTRIFSPLMSF